MDGIEVPDTGGKRENVSPRERVYLDPTLDVHDLFVTFNERFFWGMLGMVEVKWSYTMISCPGLCTFQEGGGLCTIKLSAPLLSLRPRKDLIETLLHEMIHAYLFVTDNFKGKENHGPEFQRHMNRINKEGGMNIHIYSEFPSDMSVVENHIWRCAGPCRSQQPYFGFVMRTANGPPGPSDYWWQTHARECGGSFEKVTREGKNKNGKGERKKTVAAAKGIRTFSRSFGPEKPPKSNPSTSNPSDASSSSAAADESDKGESSENKETNEEQAGNSSEIQGVASTSQSCDDFESTPGTSQVNDENQRPKRRRSQKKGCKAKKRKVTNVLQPSEQGADPQRQSVSCPVCGHSFDQELINEHANMCMEEQEFMNEVSPDEVEEDSHEHCGQCPLLADYLEQNESGEFVEASLHFYVYDEDIAGDDEPGPDKVRCPCCWKWVREGIINEHIDACLTYNTLQNNPESP